MATFLAQDPQAVHSFICSSICKHVLVSYNNGSTVLEQCELTHSTLCVSSHSAQGGRGRACHHFTSRGSDDDARPKTVVFAVVQCSLSLSLPNIPSGIAALLLGGSGKGWVHRKPRHEGEVGCCVGMLFSFQFSAAQRYCNGVVPEVAPHTGAYKGAAGPCMASWSSNNMSGAIPENCSNSEQTPLSQISLPSQFATFSCAHAL